MAGRMFDRRGRVTWDEEKRQQEDRRLRERRQGGDRRGAGVSRNWDIAERRKGSRRKEHQ